MVFIIGSSGFGALWSGVAKGTSPSFFVEVSFVWVTRARLCLCGLLWCVGDYGAIKVTVYYQCVDWFFCVDGDFLAEWGLRGVASLRKSPLTEAEHTVTVRKKAPQGTGNREENLGTGWLAAPLIGAQLVDFVLLLFDIDGYLKRYAGGLVDIRRRIAAYRVTSFGDDVIVSFTVCGSRYFGNLAHETERLLLCRSRCAKVRRQGYCFGSFNLRV